MLKDGVGEIANSFFSYKPGIVYIIEEDMYKENIMDIIEKQEEKVVESKPIKKTIKKKK
jgi:basic membrane lipoprotein Med (substrate-binding protein (PBP1-ABC) superfamily)